MSISLSSIAIVILADSHNPTIVSPYWLKENKIIEEEAVNFAHTPGFSVFESESYQLIVEQNRFQLSCKKMTMPNFEYCQEAAKKYVSLLPHVPYKAVGLNYTWQFKPLNEGEKAKITLLINNRELNKSIAGFEKVFSGGILLGLQGQQRLRLFIEPLDENVLLFKFNYNFDNKLKNDLLPFLDEFTKTYTVSEEITKKILEGDQ